MAEPGERRAPPTVGARDPLPPGRVTDEAREPGPEGIGARRTFVLDVCLAACLAAAALLPAASPAPGQEPGEEAAARGADTVAADAYLDATAARLHRAAVGKWRSIDESVVRYRAIIRQRIAVDIRTPLKDRTLYRNESAVRAFWDRDHDALIQVLGARARHPGREAAREEGEIDFLDELTIDEPFEPGGDRLLFGFTGGDREELTDPEEDVWFAHPLAPGSDTLYRYESGDILTLSLPDGRRLRTVRLDVIPREADVHRISGSLRIEPETGALVRAVYRLSRTLDAVRDIEELREEEEAGEFDMVPGLLKPWTFELSLVAVSYSLWNFEVWLPRSMRLEGQVGAGILKLPVSMDIAYSMESVTTGSDLEERTAAEEGEAAGEEVEEHRFESRAEAMRFLAGLLTDEEGTRYRPLEGATSRSDGRTTRFLVPEDPEVLETSPHLPPPIWEEAPGFASEEELEGMVGTLAELPQVPAGGTPWRLDWGWARDDLLRYNRVEALAAGARFEAELGTGVLGPVGVEASGFFGVADLEPKARLSLERETVERRVALAGYRELRSVAPDRGHLGLGNSLHALLFGRDDGEYFVAAGADLLWRPPEARRQSFRFRAYAERQDPVSTNTDFALFRAFDSDWRFRGNVAADRVEEAGGELRLSPWWGSDPLALQGGVELYGHGAAWRRVDDPVTGNVTGEYARASAIARLAVPVAEGRWRLGLEAGAGTTWGDAPVQRAWFLGGPSTLRGYDASVRAGPSFTRARLEVARSFSAGSASLFGDAGWAGDRDAFDAGDLLYGVGVGGSLLDGLVRFDLSRGLSGSEKRYRVDLYLDALL